MGASDKGASQIWANYIGGTQAWIEHAYEEFFKPLLEANGYENRFVKIRLKRPELDRSEEMREQIKVGVEAKAIDKEEIRDNLSELKLKDTTPELLTALDEQYKAPTITGFGNAVPAEQLRIEDKTQKNIEKAYSKAEKRLIKLLEDQ